VGRAPAGAERASRFVAEAAHQLRTPVAGIQACAEALLGGVSDDEQGLLLARIVRETSRAAELGACRSGSTTRCLCRRGGEGEVAEEVLHVDADGFVVAIDGGPGGRPASSPGAANAGQDGAMTWSRRTMSAVIVRTARLGTR
jgi:hypothetical protein